MLFDNVILRFYTRYQTMNTSKNNLSQKSFLGKTNNKHPYTDTNDTMNHTEDNKQPDTRHTYVSSAVHVYDTLGEVRLIPARISKFITGTDRRSVVTQIFYAIKQV
jgi:hypothetical protein